MFRKKKLFTIKTKYFTQQKIHIVYNIFMQVTQTLKVNSILKLKLKLNTILLFITL